MRAIFSRVYVPGGGQVRVPPQHFCIRWTRKSIDLIEVGGRSDVTESLHILRLKWEQAEVGAERRVPHNVRCHKNHSGLAEKSRTAWGIVTEMGRKLPQSMIN